MVNVADAFFRGQQQGSQIRQGRQREQANQFKLGNQQRIQEITGTALGQQRQAQPPLQGPQQAPGQAVLDVAQQPIDTADQDQALIELFQRDPNVAIQIKDELGLRSEQQKIEGAEFAFRAGREKDPARRNEMIQQRAQTLQSQGRDARETVSLLDRPHDEQSKLLRTVELALMSPEDRQKALNPGAGLTGAQRERGALIKAIQPALNEDGTIDPSKLDATSRSAAISLGLIPRAGQSAAERIAKDKDLTSVVAESQATITQAKEDAKSISQLKFKPLITSAVKKAEKEATAKGDTLTDFNRAKAALPGLTEVVNQLRELAPIATSTFGGGLMDAAVKQSGFGSTKGATASAKWVAIVNNQVLPLLKQTFGAAFTFQEGESLKATMGDVNASPDEKLVQLDAFIEGKIRELETQQRELEGNSPERQPKQGGKLMEDANGNKAMVFPDGSFEEVK